MRRLLLCGIASTLLAACSLAEQKEAPLASLWVVVQSALEASDTYRGGVADDRHFYAMRSRNAGGRVITAYRITDGATVWSANAGVCDPPILATERLYCAGDDLVALNTATGALLWRAELDLSQNTSGTADEARVYVGRGRFTGEDGEVIAVEATTGAVVWRRGFTGDGWIGVRTRSLTLTPEGELLVALVALYPPHNSTNNAAVLLALDPDTGNERWRVQNGGSTDYHTAGGVTVWNRLALYADRSDAVAVNLDTRTIAWRAPWTPGFVGVRRAPLVADGRAFFTDGAGYAYAVDATTGIRRWATQRPGGSWSHEVCGPVLVMNNYLLDVFDLETGEARGRLLDSDDLAGQLAVRGDVLYVSAQSGVYAFDCTS
jgi:outer membrane protein assembly factor BamB